MPTMETIAVLGEDSLARSVAPAPPCAVAARADHTGRALRNVAIEQRRVVSPLGRMLGPRLYFLTDLVALGGAAATALIATPSALSPRWFGVFFPTIVMALLHTRRRRDQRVFGSLADTTAG